MMAVEHAHSGHQAVMHTGSGPSYPFFKAGVIIGGVAGLLSGMAAANTFTRELLSLLGWSIGGAVIFCAVLSLIGWVIDTARHRRGLSLN